MSLYPFRLANEWTGLGILLGLFLGFLYKVYTEDSVRTLLYGGAIVLLGSLAFNFIAFIFSDVYRESWAGVIELIALQTLIGVALAIITGYAMFRLPFVPPGNWTPIEPAPERLVELVDTPFGSDWIWTFRAKSVQHNTFVYVCSDDSCMWQTESSFLEQDWGELSPDFWQCQKQRGGYTPRQPHHVVDTHIVHLCGADVLITIHLVLTEDGTVWRWTGLFSSLTVVGLIYMLGLSILIVFCASVVIGLARSLQYRLRAR